MRLLVKKEITKLNEGGGIAASVSKGAAAAIGMSVPGVNFMIMILYTFNTQMSKIYLVLFTKINIIIQ